MIVPALFLLLSSIPPVAPPEPMMHGVVIDGATRRPLARAHIVVNDKECAVTGPNGEFLVPVRRTGSGAIVHVHRPGYYRKQVNVATIEAPAAPHGRLEATVPLQRVPGPAEQMFRKLNSAWNNLIGAGRRK